jgi:dihydrofolate reductase
MGKVLAEMSMSLDGFVADPADGVDELHAWYGSGEVETPAGDSRYTFRTSEGSSGVLRDAMASSGALITGRRNFDIAAGWGGAHPLGVPVVVVSHSIPDGWPRDDAPFTFVDSVEKAVSKAKDLAGEKTVVIASPSIAQQCLNAGVLDEIAVSLIPVLLGKGIPYFANLEKAPVLLDGPRVIEGSGVTHLIFAVGE